MNYTEKTIIIFHSLFKRLENYHQLILTRPALISYSGGKDSSLLLNFYQYLYDFHKIPEPKIFHLNHKIRKNNKQEEEISSNYNQNYSFPAYFKARNIPFLSKQLKFSIEETGRIYRYKLMEQLCKKFGLYIVTGHHCMDYMETILINLIRGGGQNIFRAYNVYENNRFKPIIKLTRLEYNDLLNENTCAIFEDESNMDNQYLRNRIRNQVLPLLYSEGLSPDKVYENFHENLIYLYNQNEFTPFSYLEINSPIKLLSITDLKQLIDIHLKLLRLHPILRNQVIEIFQALQIGSNFTIENREVMFWMSPTSPLYIIPKKSILWKGHSTSYVDNKEILNFNNHSMQLIPNTTVHSYKNGSKIYLYPLHKKVSEIFRENHIPTPIRKYFPIVYKDNEVYQIPLNLWNSKLKCIQKLDSNFSCI